MYPNWYSCILSTKEVGYGSYRNHFTVLIIFVILYNYTLRFNEVGRGVYWFHLVRLSVCGQNRVRSVSSTICVGYISYLHILSNNFRRCVACNVCFKIQKFEILANSLNFQLWLCLLLTWDPIGLNGMGNHEAAGGILRTQAFELFLPSDFTFPDAFSCSS